MLNRFIISNQFRFGITARMCSNTTTASSSNCTQNVPSETSRTSTVLSSKSQQYKKICNSFMAYLEKHRMHASNSIMVRSININGIDKAKHILLNQLHTGGISNHVKQAVLYTKKRDKVVNAVIEFEDFDAVSDSGVLASLFESPASKGSKPRVFKWKRNVDHSDNTCDVPVDIVHTDIGSIDSIIKPLQTSESISDQIVSIFDAIRLRDGGVRQRFLVCQLLESARLLETDKRIEIYPFGSTISGVGKCDSDLDLVLCQLMPDISGGSYKVYRDRHELEQDISEVGDGLDMMGGVLVDLVIPRARVPIVKFRHSPTRLECDICLSEDAALPMAELVRVMCEWQPWVRALVVVVHLWARHCGLVTGVLGGHHIKNLVLTCMTIFYLQQRNLLPSYNALVDFMQHIQQQATGTYMDLNYVAQPSSVSPSDLHGLLLGFFTYYRQFEYNMFALDIATGGLVKKTGAARARKLNVINPLGCHPFNIAYNVSSEQFRKFLDALEVAAWKLEYSNEVRDDRPWGVMALFDNSHLDVKTFMGT